MTHDNARPAAPDIEAIFLDVGNTLRIVLDDPPFHAQAKADLMTLVGVQEPEEAFFERLEARWNAYRKASKKSLIEASERDLWTVHLLPDYPPERIGPLAGKLTRLWRDHDGRRVPRPTSKRPSSSWIAAAIAWGSSPTPSPRPKSPTGWNRMG